MEELTLVDYLAIIRRWKKLFATVALARLFVGLIVAFRWSNYRATAVVQIEQSEISSTATSPMGSPHDAAVSLADQRISEIQQKVYLKCRILQECLSPPPVFRPRRSIDIRFHQSAQPLHKQIYPAGEIAPVRVDQRDRQRLGAVLGQDLNQVAGA